MFACVDVNLPTTLNDNDLNGIKRQNEKYSEGKQGNREIISEQ